MRKRLNYSIAMISQVTENETYLEVTAETNRIQSAKIKKITLETDNKLSALIKSHEFDYYETDNNTIVILKIYSDDIDAVHDLITSNESFVNYVFELKKIL